ncbi:uncharacterized protein UBRO_20444 [Ustilago bromivora]|uniref:Uncharacterized protein n=1 Tax=Ustilago bromivora TaxID=307758 RepID=A0A1K0FWH7_9BASI|nr:uncharacterized protein UBRO_20444 [Ustilago bromivora]
MVRGNELSPSQRASIIAMHDTGLPIRQIAELSGVSKTAVHKTIHNFKVCCSQTRQLSRLATSLDAHGLVAGKTLEKTSTTWFRHSVPAISASRYGPALHTTLKPRWLCSHWLQGRSDRGWVINEILPRTSQLSGIAIGSLTARSGML